MGKILKKYAKLSKEQKAQIVKRFEEGVSAFNIAVMFGVGYSAIRKVLVKKGVWKKRWKRPRL